MQIETARAIYQHMLQFFPQKKSVWLAAAHFEKQYGMDAPAGTLLLFIFYSFHFLVFAFSILEGKDGLLPGAALRSPFWRHFSPWHFGFKQRPRSII